MHPEGSAASSKALGRTVFDMKIAEDFSILESQKEFVRRYCQHREIIQIMKQSDFALNDAAVDTLFGDVKKEVRLHEGASSDGSLAHIFRHTAKELFNGDVGVLTYRTLRSKDFQEVTLEWDREVMLRFEAAYGFQNIKKWS
ncbi:hypothetical protein QTO34_018188 [Cnephaeus nilssonii]|uniref:Uncharacterized protein n=1 Tax=Cnephaeus nilssonii TaxID=3371016 RepID=A0AA40HYC4_CNENI|nr:hypothetical protein QTO34_018188 [Eptesicus nilssonii]